MGGLNGASALLVALRHQARCGEGQFVDLSQVEGLFPLAAHGIMHYSATGAALPRNGNRTDQASPQGVYGCSGEDNWIVIQVFNDAQWQALCQEATPYLDGISDRFGQRDALDAAITRWTKNQEAHQLMLTLQAKHIPAAATHKASTLLEDPQLASRGFWQWMDRAVVGRQPNPSAPFRSTSGATVLRSPAPTLGEHNHQVLVDELGISEQEFERLMKSGVIGSRPRMPS